MLFHLLEILTWLQPEATGGGGGGGGGAGGGGAGGPPAGSCATQIGLLAVMILVFYFLLIRPQRKREQERAEMLKALRKGQTVRTTGGIRGEITYIDEREATLLVADKTKINVLRSHIAGLEGEDAAPAASGGKKADKPKDEGKKPKDEGKKKDAEDEADDAGAEGDDEEKKD